MKFKVSFLFYYLQDNCFFAEMIIANIASCLESIFGVVLNLFSTMLSCAYKQHTTSPSNECMFIYMNL